MSVDAPEVLEIRQGMTEFLTMDFDEDISSGEVITGTPAIAIADADGVTAGTATFSGTVVKALFAATAGAGLGRRVVTITVTTDLGQILPRCGLLQVVKCE